MKNEALTGWKANIQFNTIMGLTVVAILILSVACSRPSDETQIRDALTAMQNAVEAGKPADFMTHVADDFTGEAGTLDRAALHNLLRGQALTNAHIGVTLSLVEVELQGDRATVRASVALTGGNGRWSPERGSIQRIESGWRKQDGHWRCINAGWERSL